MEKIKLGNIADIITGPFGSALHASDYVLEGIPCIMPQDIEDRTLCLDNIARITQEDADRLSKYKVIYEDIVYARRGDVEKHAFIKSGEEGYLCGTGCLRVRVNSKEYLPEYVSFYLNLPESKKWLSQHAVGSNMPNLNTDILSDVPIGVCSLDLQKKIVNQLKIIEDKIQNNRLQNIKLENLAKRIYDFWFLQFNFPNGEGEAYTSSGGKMVWNEKLGKEIPEGWNVKKVSEVVGIQLGGTPSTKNEEYWNGSINWLNSGEVAQFPVVESELTITESGLNSSATKLLKKGTVVVSITGNIRASILGMDSCANQSVVGIEENTVLKKSFLYPLMKDLVYYYEVVSTGNCQQHISKGIIEDTYTIIPSEKILMMYYENVEPYYDMIIKNGLENKKLKKMRDFLLPRLMNGQISFKEK